MIRFRKIFRNEITRERERERKGWKYEYLRVPIRLSSFLPPSHSVGETIGSFLSSLFVF